MPEKYSASSSLKTAFFSLRLLRKRFLRIFRRISNAINLIISEVSSLLLYLYFLMIFSLNCLIKKDLKKLKLSKNTSYFEDIEEQNNYEEQY